MSKKKQIPEFFINAFYESKFRGNFFVIKAGGKVIEDKTALTNLLSNIRDLNMQGIKIMLIYGGGRAMDIESEKRGIEVKKVDGLRVNAKENIDVMKHIIGGDLSLSIAGAMKEAELEGLNFNALPADWADITLKPKVKGDDYTGQIERIHERPINRLFKVTDFIACSCLCISDNNAICNINADKIATQIAIATKAHKLIFLSDVDGVEIKGETAEIITAEQIDGYIKDGTATGGMMVKLTNCKAALDAGVRRIHLLSGLRKDALKKEIYEPVGPGTMLFNEDEREAYENETEAQKMIQGQK